MIILRFVVAAMLTLSMPNFLLAADDTDDRSGSDSGNKALTSALFGGLLGAGLGAAIGSASGKAGQGAAIGAGVGAVGGTLVGAEKERRERENSYAEQEAETPEDIKIKKRIIREYDEEGNIVSEREVAR